MEHSPSEKIVPPKGNQSKKIFIAILIVALIGIGVAFVFKFIENKELTKQAQAQEVRLNQVYDQLDSMSNELDTRILKITQLGGEIDALLLVKSQLEKDKKAIRKHTYKQINELQGRIQGYKELLQSQDEEIVRLKALNDSLHVENFGLKKEANTLNDSIGDLNKNQAQLEEKIAVASKLKIDRVSVVAVSTRKKERISPFKNRHIDQLKIQFEVLENKVAPIEGKGILVKITDPEGKVMFDVAVGSGTFIFEGRENFYTIKKDILYDRNSLPMTFLYTKGTDYMLGRHKIAVYTDDYKMGEGVFVVSR